MPVPPLRRIGIGVALILIGAGVFEALHPSRESAQFQVIQQREQQLVDQATQATHERDDAMDRLAALQSENQQLRARIDSLQDASRQLTDFETRDSAEAHDPIQAPLLSWLGRVNRLRQRLEENPGQQIPEMQNLTDQDWLNATHEKLDTEEDYLRAMSALRTAAERDFQPALSSALEAYAKANNQQFPANISQLQPYFPTPVDNSILERWEVSPDSSGQPSITQKTPVDPNDSRFWVYANEVFSIQRGTPYVWQQQ